MKTIDINCDLGEGFGNEADIMPYISSCNIACGGHAGGLAEMDKCVDLALDHSVKIGAHPSYPDRENFGRSVLNIPMGALTKSIVEQINCLNTIVMEKGSELNHIKPHGALYNESTRNPMVARAVTEAIKQVNPNLRLYAPYKSFISNMAQSEGIKVSFEAFADRSYEDDMTLTPRSVDGSVLKDLDQIFNQVMAIIERNNVTSRIGKKIDINAETICIHGDNPAAIEIAQTLDYRLQESGIQIT